MRSILGVPLERQVMFLSLPEQLIIIFWLLIGIRNAFAFLNYFYAVWAGYPPVSG